MTFNIAIIIYNVENMNELQATTLMTNIETWNAVKKRVEIIINQLYIW